MKEISGNILLATENIICHQVNCLGIMGGGLANQIRTKFPNVFVEYKLFCKQRRYDIDSLLGNVQFCEIGENKFVANLFGQYAIGSGVQTHYESLEHALFLMAMFARMNNFSVAIPYKLGCGLAGGDWKIVLPIIEKMTGGLDVCVYSLEEK